MEDQNTVQSHTFTVDDPPELHDKGKYFLVKGDELVSTDSGEYVGDEATGLMALSQICPHMLCALSFNTERNQFVCPCHGSVFDRTGVCLKGPSNRNMDQYEVSVDAAGIVSVEVARRYQGKPCQDERN